MRRSLKLFGRLLVGLATVMLLVAAGSMACARFTGLEMMSVESGSMAPRFHKGDAVLLDRHLPPLRTGLIVSYASPRDSRVIITHRITAVDPVRRTIQTKGDNLLTPDPAVPMTAVQGTVRFGIPHAGAVLDSIRTPVGLAVIIYVPAISIIVSELVRLKRRYGGNGSGRYVLHGY